MSVIFKELLEMYTPMLTKMLLCIGVIPILVGLDLWSGIQKAKVDVQGLFKVEDYIQNDGLTLLAIFTKLTNEQKEETI